MAGSAMTTPLLVRHPAPFPTESLLGYILRLSEENGYTTPWSLLLLGRIGQHEARSTGMKVAKLAQVSNRSQTELQSISYRWPGDRLEVLSLAWEFTDAMGIGHNPAQTVSGMRRGGGVH